MKHILLFFLMVSPLSANDQILMNRLQATNVTIKTRFAQGSGSLFNRSIANETITFVWTAAHVIDDLRRTRTVIDSSGTTRTIVEFEDARIVQELVEDGRRVGELQMDARVIRYSDSENGEDLALLQVRKLNYINPKFTTQFYLGDNIPSIGTELYHVGSLKGQFGANSLTTGVVSQIGRVLDVGTGVVFDQTTVTAFPGSSGGGVYFKSNGQYMGMLVRGGGEQFNFIVPIRRIKKWAIKADVYWALDPSVPLPANSDVRSIEDTGVSFE